MIQPSHFWVFIQENWNQDLEEILALLFHCSIIPNNQNVETNVCNRWMDKENVTYTENKL